MSVFRPLPRPMPITPAITHKIGSAYGQLHIKFVVTTRNYAHNSLKLRATTRILVKNCTRMYAEPARRELGFVCPNLADAPCSPITPAITHLMCSIQSLFRSYRSYSLFPGPYFLSLCVISQKPVRYSFTFYKNRCARTHHFSDCN